MKITSITIKAERVDGEPDHTPYIKEISFDKGVWHVTNRDGEACPITPADMSLMMALEQHRQDYDNS